MYGVFTYSREAFHPWWELWEEIRPRLYVISISRFARFRFPRQEYKKFKIGNTSTSYDTYVYVGLSELDRFSTNWVFVDAQLCKGFYCCTDCLFAYTYHTWDSCCTGSGVGVQGQHCILWLLFCCPRPRLMTYWCTAKSWNIASTTPSCQHKSYCVFDSRIIPAGMVLSLAIRAWVNISLYICSRSMYLLARSCMYMYATRTRCIYTFLPTWVKLSDRSVPYKNKETIACGTWRFQREQHSHLWRATYPQLVPVPAAMWTTHICMGDGRRVTQTPGTWYHILVTWSLRCVFSFFFCSERSYRVIPS